jgi:hypothetical protein
MLQVALVSCLFACGQAQPHTTLPDAVVPHRAELASGGVNALNYTSWYIHEFEIQGPSGSDIHGGGANIMPVKENGRPSESGETCCMTYPEKWQPDLRLTVRWLVFKDIKKLGAKAPGYWYKAENVRIAQYRPETGGVWMIFLPDDRVRLMIVDGNHDGGNNPNNRPSDDDPLIVQGVVDKEWNELYPNGVARGVQ